MLHGARAGNPTSHPFPMMKEFLWQKSTRWRSMLEARRTEGGGQGTEGSRLCPAGYGAPGRAVAVTAAVSTVLQLMRI